MFKTIFVAFNSYKLQRIYLEILELLVMYVSSQYLVNFLIFWVNMYLISSFSMH